MYQPGRYLASNVHQIRTVPLFTASRSQPKYLRGRGLTQMMLD